MSDEVVVSRVAWKIERVLFLVVFGALCLSLYTSQTQLTSTIESRTRESQQRLEDNTEIK